jgi:secreted trypsin-like serine protease
MGAYQFVRRPLYAILVAALVATVASLLLFVQSGKAAQVAVDQHHDGKVVGGTTVPDGKYKFVAALLNTNYCSTAFEQQFCGATLIDGNSVLTAAHCVEGVEVEPASPLRVIVGRTVLDSNQGQERTISQIVIHPDWDNSTFVNDAAVLKLSSPVSGITPIKLATSSQNFLESPGRNTTVAGWGNTVGQPADGSDAGSSYPNRMREAQVPIVSDSSAEQVYDPIYGPSGYIPPIQVAAGKTGKDTCQGDSGGPIFALAGGKYRQIGITSWGIGCGASGYPGVYAEVNASSIRGFITTEASK